MSGSVRAFAPAKINPWLHVLARRADGFHELDLAFLALQLCDEVRVSRSADGEVRTRTGGPQHSADIVDGPRNLAWRAAELALVEARARGACGAETGLVVELDKHVPSQSGLGGASSDAAATWLAARSLLGLPAAGAEELAQLATLGSDCAFFAAAPAGCARGRGRGERIEPFEAGAWHVGLVVPDCGCPTPAVYAALGYAPGQVAAQAEAEPRVRFVGAGRARNDLEPAALSAEPRLRAWRGALDRARLDDWFLSGSGSSFCGIYEDASKCAAAVERLAEALDDAGLRPRLLRAVAAGPGARLA